MFEFEDTYVKHIQINFTYRIYFKFIYYVQ